MCVCVVQSNLEEYLPSISMVILLLERACSEVKEWRTEFKKKNLFTEEIWKCKVCIDVHNHFKNPSSLLMSAKMYDTKTSFLEAILLGLCISL